MEINFSLSEFEARLEQAKKSMDERGLDGLLVFSPQNIYYLTGYDATSYVHYQVLIVSKREPSLTLLISTMAERVLKETSFLKDYRLIPFGGGNPIQQTTEILEEKGLSNKTIGIEKDTNALKAKDYESLVASLNNKFTMVDASDLIGQIRVIKSPQEIEYVREAGKLATLAVQSAFSMLEEGITEFEFCAEIQRALVSNGSGYSAVPLLISSGPRAAMNMYHNAANRKINKGDMTSVELDGVCKRYHAVIARTVVIGKPSKRVAELYKGLQEVMTETCSIIKPGVQTGKVYSTLQNAFDKRNIKQRSLLWGDGVGIGYPPSWHEIEPGIKEGGQFMLQPGMVFLLFPFIMLPEEGIGLRLADTFLVTANGYEPITTASRELTIK
jgi:Xaa-Pro aminopeptidase